MKRKVIKQSGDGNLNLEQIGNSIYFHRGWGEGRETRRYMDITSAMNADEFIRIGKRMAEIGSCAVAMYQKPYIDVWECEHEDLGKVAAMYELEPYWSPYPRYEIYINEYSFVYYPKGNDRDVESYLLDVWNFNVPDYRNGHVYVRMVTYDGFVDSMTDAELHEACVRQLEKLRKVMK